MAAIGKKWCRVCMDWLPTESVTKNGLCRPHENALHRRLYADPSSEMKAAYSARKAARKRNLAVVTPWMRTLIFDRFDGLCAYCSAPADTLDHVVPVKHGGDSSRGNLVPACLSCNCRKKTKSLEDFLGECVRRGLNISDQIGDELCMEHV